MSHEQTTKEFLKKKQAEANLNEAIAKARGEHLAKVATLNLFTMDMLLQNEHDRLCVAATLFGGIAARGKGTWEELTALLREAYEDQVKRAATAPEQQPALVQSA